MYLRAHDEIKGLPLDVGVMVIGNAVLKSELLPVDESKHVIL